MHDSLHNELLEKFDYLYSTSANLSGENYNEGFAKQNADVVIEPSCGFSENEPSKIIKVGKNRLKRVR